MAKTHRRFRLAPVLRALGAWLLSSDSGLESPAHINRRAWAWVKEFRADLQEDFEQRVDL